MTRPNMNALLVALLDEPPADRTSLDPVLRDLSKKERNALREAVVRCLDADDAPSSRHIALLEAFLSRLGVNGVGDALGRLVENPARDLAVRRVAANALLVAGETDALGALEPDVADAVFTGLLRSQIMAQPDPGAFLAQMVTAGFSPDNSGEAEAALLEVAERARRELGRTYVEFYLPLIKGTGKAPRALAAPVVAALVAAAQGESDPETQAALVLLRGRGGDPKSRRAAQKAVLETGTAGLSPAPTAGPAPAGAKGYLSSADGAGALVVLATLPQPDGSLMLVNVCLRLIGDLRDGFVLPGQRARDIGDIIEQFRASASFVETTLEHVAHLSIEAADRTLALGIELPKDAVPGLRLLRPYALSTASAEIAPAPRVTLAAVRALLSRPEYSAWFFDLGDFASAGLRLHKALVTPSHIESTLTALKGTFIPERIVALARHQARWHTLKGEPEAAALMAACSLQAETDFEHSVLGRLMAERGTADIPGGGVDKPTVGVRDYFGEPDQRRLAHGLIFGDGHPSRAVDLARLDFAVALESALNTLAVGMASELVPRPKRVIRFADAVAKSAAEHLMSRGPAKFDSDAVFAPFRALLDNLYAQAPERIRDDLAHNVGITLNNHVNGLCIECPLQCFANQKRRFREAIEAPAHPVATTILRRRG